MKKLYGHETINNWSNIGADEIRLNQEHLTRFEMGLAGPGCCFGMSIDFISRYLKELKQNKTLMEAVKTVAPICAEGATPEAEIAHIFSSALDASLVTFAADIQTEWDVRWRLLN